MIYPISFLVSLISLILWFLFKKEPQLSRLMSKVFFGGFLVYLFSIAFAEASIDFKFQTVIRDFLILSGTAILVNIFQRNKQLLFGLVAGIGMVFYAFYLPILKNNFPEKASTSTVTTTENKIKLDKDWELLIDLKDTESISDLNQIIAAYNLNVEKAFNGKNLSQSNLDDYYAVNIPNEHETRSAEIKTRLQESGFVEWLEENEQFNLSPIESKLPKKINRKFGINDPNLEKMWGFEMMEVEKLYEFLSINNIRPKKKAAIFILDSGVDAKHEDLSARYRSIKKSYDNDPNGHGTHCAGIAAAVTNNGIGIASFTPNNDFVEVTGIKVMMALGIGTQRMIIQGMLVAADNEADVVSMSLGAPSNDASQKAFNEAVEYVNNADGIVIAAAGNSNSDANEYTPAGAKNVIAVAAVDTLMNKASFSSYVNDIEMAVSAPGVSVFSTYPDNKYQTFSGTSMACPHVSGLVGLMRSLNPNLTTKEVFHILEATGKKTGDLEKTGRMIYPIEAVKMTLALAQK